MEAILGVFGNLLSGVTDIATTVTATPPMMIGIAAAVGGIAIGWWKSLTGQRRKSRR